MSLNNSLCEITGSFRKLVTLSEITLSHAGTVPPPRYTWVTLAFAPSPTLPLQSQQQKNLQRPSCLPAVIPATNTAGGDKRSGEKAAPGRDWMHEFTTKVGDLRGLVLWW